MPSGFPTPAISPQGEDASAVLELSSMMTGAVLPQEQPSQMAQVAHDTFACCNAATQTYEMVQCELFIPPPVSMLVKMQLQ